MVKTIQDSRRCDLRDAFVYRWLESLVNQIWNMLPEPLMRPKVLVEVDMSLGRPAQLGSQPLYSEPSKAVEFYRVAVGFRNF